MLHVSFLQYMTPGSASIMTLPVVVCNVGDMGNVLQYLYTKPNGLI